MLLDKSERFQLFIKKLEEEKAAKSDDEAFERLANTLNRVENEFSNIPYSPNEWMSDGRMYPPQIDNKMVTDNPNINRYRSKQHNTYIGTNGSIKIVEINGNKTIIDKAGLDQRKVDEL